MTETELAKKYYTVKQIAEAKKVSKEAVLRWIKEKKLSTETFNNMLLIPRTKENEEEIKAYQPREYPRGK